MGLWFDFRQRGWLTPRGAPEQRVFDSPVVKEVALLGADLAGARPAVAVEPGDRVGAGDVLFTLRRDPRTAFVAPVGGTVRRIDRGPRRTLSTLVIAAEARAEGPAGPVAADIAEALLARGLWPAFRSRPFGHIPPADARPAAIFVTATAAWPGAPDPRVTLAGRGEALAEGLSALTRLTGGPVFLCQPRGAALASGIARVEVAPFDGPPPAGLAGTHVRALWRPAAGTVWTIGAQDVAAIGHLLATGCHDGSRIVALSGPRAARPRLVSAPLGARLADLTAAEAAPGAAPARRLAGSAIAGREAAYLSRHDLQVTIETQPEPPRRPAPAGPRPIIPHAGLERALPRGIAAVPLLRALAAGDAAAVQRLGAGMMIEEDLALATRLCLSGQDYGVLLRRALDELEEAA